ncbi:response regulator [Bacillus sp. 31A1R]|uniref:Response regulator n=1 Tax=Robertmurraya mangrovi TaxID=3098077 RepID=A0ABU5IYN8_9BACI|nr:response regulator [Bacillus sp. 31A1R]MDZ5472294.1 response regulator [Bacillus sp. 31A1R]
MYKILIVDDEKNIRQGIQAMIQREYPTFETFIAADGLDALECTEQEQPDILITDIKMPRLDGIQLIKELQERDQKPALIILSGYDDFSYAKEAIKHRVKDYLLKPVNRKELFKTLNTIIEELESNHKMTYQHMDEYRASQLNYILLNPNLNKEDIHSLFKKMQIGSYPDGYYVMIVDSSEELQGVDLLQRIHELLPSELNGNYLSFLDKDGRTVLITANVQILPHLKEQLARDRNFVFSVGVSEKADDLTELKDVYNQAESALKYHFLYPRSQVIFYEKVKGKQEISSLPVDLINKISNMLGTDREKEIKSYLLQIMDFEVISKNDISYLENVNKEINETIFKSFFARLGEESLETFKLLNKMSEIYNFDNFNDYFHALEDFLMRIHEYHKQMKSVYSEQKYMDKAIEYIRENYHKDLNLAVVSNYISLNYSYFSHMFKEFTGQNFVDYLKMVRIEEARRLLKETDFKVFEISEMVGYKNPKQFARVFREIEGISPKEYRETK